MPLLTKEQALKVERRKFRDLDVPELGGTLRVASISAGCGLRAKELDGSAAEQRLTSLAMFESCIVDENGRPMFSAEEAAAFLESISVETLSLILSAITELSGKPKSKSANGAEVPAGNPSAAAPSASLPSA